MLNRETAMLILQRGNQAGRSYPLDQAEIIIGRSPDCDIVLDDRQVSRRHARVFREGDRYLVEDLGSKNNTHLNGRDLIGVTPLQDGDEIQIALRFKLAFVDAEQTAPLVGERLLTPPLSLPQYRLLELLLDAAGGVVSRDEVIRCVWSEDVEEGISEQAIDALVRRLRERLAEMDPSHAYVLTVRGHGFRFQNRDAGAAPTS